MTSSRELLADLERELAGQPFDGAVPRPGYGPSPTLKAARKAERELELACAGDAALLAKVTELRCSLREHADRAAHAVEPTPGARRVGWRRALRMGRTAFLDVLREYQLPVTTTKRSEYRPESAVLGCYYGIALAFATRYAWILVRNGVARAPRRQGSKRAPKVLLPELRVRAFREEHERWRQAAERAGVDLPTWVREHLHRAASTLLGPAPAGAWPRHRRVHGPEAGDASLLARP